jgi:elongation factor G
VLFKETIAKSAEAEAQHRRQLGPKNDYAHVKIRVVPLSPGSGARLQPINPEFFPKEYFPGVEQGLISALATGPVGRYEVTDLEAEVVSGSYHDVDSSLNAFVRATEDAVRKAVRAAEPHLLEPLTKFSLEVSEEFVGAAMGELTSREGRIERVHPIKISNHLIIEAVVPERNSSVLEEALRYYTRSQIHPSASPGGYQALPESIATRMQYCAGCERKVLPAGWARCPDCGSTLGSGDDFSMV